METAVHIIQEVGGGQNFAEPLREILKNEAITAAKEEDVKEDLKAQMEEEVATSEVAKESIKAETQGSELKKAVWYMEVNHLKVKATVEASPPFLPFPPDHMYMCKKHSFFRPHF